MIDKEKVGQLVISNEGFHELREEIITLCTKILYR